MDAITLLKADHKDVEQLFKRFEKAGDHAYTEKRAIVDRIIEALSKHAAVEEQLFYPVVRATVPDTDAIALESLEEHHVVKWVLSELEQIDPQHERFDAKVTVLIENVRHHVEEEEQEFFPKVRDELGRNALSDLGDAMVQAKKLAPTHPHPRSPDTPPGNLATGPLAGMVDRVGDTISGVTQGGVTSLGDLIALIMGRKRPTVSPTGSSTSRSTAAKVRGTAATTTEAAIDAVKDARRSAEKAVKGAARTTRAKSATAAKGVRSTAGAAKTGATRTARAATSGARSTATTARKSAKPVARSAKRASTTTGRAAKKAAKNTRTTATRAVNRTAATTARS
jgi:hemerythrin superfamily protein